MGKYHCDQPKFIAILTDSHQVNQVQPGEFQACTQMSWQISTTRSGYSGFHIELEGNETVDESTRRGAGSRATL